MLINGAVSTASTVEVQLTGGTAIKGTDFTINSTIINIPVGDYDGTSVTGIPIPITLIDDAVPEADETISVKIVNFESPEFL